MTKGDGALVGPGNVDDGLQIHENVKYFKQLEAEEVRNRCDRKWLEEQGECRDHVREVVQTLRLGQSEVVKPIEARVHIEGERETGHRGQAVV